jgi:hypothetical protein
VKGILKLGYKLLVNDKAKFTALLLGITFAVFLIMFITSMFFGVLNHASATAINIGSTLWVMDPYVESVSNSVGMPNYVLDAVRSMQGVKYAVPLYSGGALVKLADGNYQSVSVICLQRTRAGSSSNRKPMEGCPAKRRCDSRQVVASVQLVKALGGGWDAAQIPSGKEVLCHSWQPMETFS